MRTVAFFMRRWHTPHSTTNTPSSLWQRITGNTKLADKNPDLQKDECQKGSRWRFCFYCSYLLSWTTTTTTKQQQQQQISLYRLDHHKSAVSMTPLVSPGCKYDNNSSGSLNMTMSGKSRGANFKSWRSSDEGAAVVAARRDSVSMTAVLGAADAGRGFSSSASATPAVCEPMAGGALGGPSVGVRTAQKSGVLDGNWGVPAAVVGVEEDSSVRSPSSVSSSGLSTAALRAPVELGATAVLQRALASMLTFSMDELAFSRMPNRYSSISRPSRGALAEQCGQRHAFLSTCICR